MSKDGQWVVEATMGLLLRTVLGGVAAQRPHAEGDILGETIAGPARGLIRSAPASASTNGTASLACSTTACRVPYVRQHETILPLTVRDRAGVAPLGLRRAFVTHRSRF